MNKIINTDKPEVVEIKGKVRYKDEELDFDSVEVFKGKHRGQTVCKFQSQKSLARFSHCYDWSSLSCFKRMVRKLLNGKTLKVRFQRQDNDLLWAEKTENGIEFQHLDISGNREFSFEIAVEDIRALFLAIEHYSGRKVVWRDALWL